MMEKFPTTSRNPEALPGREVFESRLQGIVHTNVSVENIDTYADTVLDQLIELTGEVTEAYTRINPDTEGLSDDTLENTAYGHFGLSSIGETLVRAQNIQQTISGISQYIAEIEANTPDEYLIPPGSRPLNLGNGESELVAKEIIPRLKTLLFLLESDCNIEPDAIILTKGEVDTRWFREEPYFRVEIPSLERVVYICEEEGNASYIFDSGILDAVGISLDQLDRGSKEDLNAVISELPGIGVRVIQQVKWREIMNELLTNPLPPLEEDSLLNQEGNAEQKEYAEVSNDDLDVWKGFYTDEEGGHWGTTMSVVTRLSADREWVVNAISEHAVPSQKVKGQNGRILTAYSWEHLIEIPVFKEYLSAPRVELTGEWKGYFIDAEGNHWSSITTLADRLGFTNPRSLQKYLPKEFETKVVKPTTGKNCPAFCLEQVLQLPELKQYMETPQVERSGEWRGFYADEHGRHWATIKQIEKLLGAGHVERPKPNSSTKQVVSLSGTISPSYCWEEVLEIPEIIQYVANRKIQSVSKDTNDPWQGFFQDEFGNHWSTVSCLADHIGIAYQTLTKILSDECDSLSNQSLRVNGLSHTGYCLEELLEIPEVKFYKETPRVAESGEWRGFYTDQDGNHWAPTSLISNRLDLGNRRVEDLIDDSQKAIHILSLRGWRDKAYCWESLLQLPVIDAYRHLPRVETEGEWKGFHIDQNGNHWGAIHTLASRLGLQFETMQQKLTLQTGLSTLQIRSLGGVTTAYCLEEIQKV